MLGCSRDEFGVCLVTFRWECNKFKGKKTGCTWPGGGCAIGTASNVFPPIPKNCLRDKMPAGFHKFVPKKGRSIIKERMKTMDLLEQTNEDEGEVSADEKEESGAEDRSED